MKSFTKHNLVRVALLLGGAALVAKMIGAKKNQWTGLSESEVRHKVETRLPDRVTEEKRSAVADKVVAKMKSRGLLGEDVDDTDAEVPEELESENTAAVDVDVDDEPSH